MSEDVRIKILDDFDFDSNSFVKITKMGPITELVTMEKRPHDFPVRRLDKDNFVDLKTGELKEYKHSFSRAGSVQSVKRTLSNIRALVNTNVVEAENVRWVTLTYRENMTDTVRLYNDFHSFWKRFCYWCKKQGHKKPEYITVQEPQGRGAWHIHAFFIWNQKAPFISNNDVLEKLWPHGFTKCKAVNDIDNIGAYFSAYLGDMSLEEIDALPDAERQKALSYCVKIEDKKIDDDGKENTKKFVKGARLHFYPSGMNIVRRSKGIKNPEVEMTTLEMARKKAPAGTETFSQTYSIVGVDGEAINTIRKAYYNSNRKSGK